MLDPLQGAAPVKAGRDALCQYLMLAFCILFGLAMIANTFVAGDGLWFWYATLLRDGHRLYADMHLPLQPLFVLETEGTLRLLGDSWLASRFMAALHLIFYAVGMLLLVRRSTLSDVARALVLGAAFFVSILSVAYRFDDYHVFAESLVLYSLVLLLNLQRQAATRRMLLLAAALGVGSGLSLATRINDGAALLVGVVLAVLCLAPRRGLAAASLTVLAALLTLAGVVRLTGDSLHDYAVNAIFRAAGSKGGAANVLAYPLALPREVLPYLHTRMYLCCFILSALAVFLLAPLRLRRARQNWIKAAAGLLLGLVPLRYVFIHFGGTNLILGVAAVAVIVLYGFGIYAFARFVQSGLAPRQTTGWNRREILMLIPLGQLASMAMSTGGRHYGIYGPAAMLILLLPIASPIRLPTPSLRHVGLVMAAILIVYAAVFRCKEPYSWHSYVAHPMFTQRQWYRHPIYGPLFIERDLLAFAQPVCDIVGMGDRRENLLSVPYPFGNYFCNTPPWHGFVQTYYDTSTRETIAALIVELQTAPPRWILYQKQPESLVIHEQVFNRGQPLPHRRLNELIEGNLAERKWTSLYTSSYGSNLFWSNQWLLIRTAPPNPPQTAAQQTAPQQTPPQHP